MRTEKELDIAYEVEKSKYIYKNAGSSKEVYQLVSDTTTIVKIPRALGDMYGLDGDSIDTYKPTSVQEVEEVLDSIYYQNEGMVWPVGQLLVEIFVWEKLLELEMEGYDISCFARIEDYYFDMNGIPVIKQEAVETRYPSDEEWESFGNQFDVVSAELENRWGIHIHDVREGNIGFDEDGQPKLYDFGMINYLFDNYEDYESYADSCSYYEDEDEEDC